MRHSFKILVNTGASYIRIIANAIVTIIVTRIALSELGVQDFGLYNLMAGTIALLSFVNSALLISAQRFFSIAIGREDTTLLKQYFASSIIIHLFLACIVITILLCIQPILFGYLLNIESGKEYVAMIVYDIMVISSGLTMVSIPYAAMMNAYEDIAALSFINIGSYIIRLFAALSIIYFDHHLLIIYASIILVSILFKIVGEIIWCRKYTITRLKIFKWINRRICTEMLGFSGWNTLGSFSILIRDEGVAVVLNMFFGTAINAAYGIANQVNSLVLSFAANLTTVFAPSIIQAKGANDNNKMLFLASFSSKIASTLSCMMALPIITFMHPILCIWLTTIPEHTEVFCQYIIYCFLIQQIYPGINRMIYATGSIKYYQIGMFSAFISILPIGYVLFQQQYPPQSILYAMTISQIAVMWLSIHIAHKNCKLKVWHFVSRSIIIPTIIFIGLLTLCKLIFNQHLHVESISGILLSSCIIVIVYLIIAIRFNLTTYERQIILQLIHNLKKKLL